MSHGPKCSRLKINYLVLTQLKSLNPTQIFAIYDSSFTTAGWEELKWLLDCSANMGEPIVAKRRR